MNAWHNFFIEPAATVVDVRQRDRLRLLQSAVWMFIPLWAAFVLVAYLARGIIIWVPHVVVGLGLPLTVFLTAKLGSYRLATWLATLSFSFGVLLRIFLPPLPDHFALLPAYLLPGLLCGAFLLRWRQLIWLVMGTLLALFIWPFLDSRVDLISLLPGIGVFLISFTLLYFVFQVRQLDEERRRQELELSRQIITQLPDAVVVTDHQQRIVRWLGNAEAIFGYSEADAVGQSIRLLFPREAPAGQEQTVAEQIARLKQYTDYYRVRRQDGQLIDVETNVREWQASDGETEIRHVGVFRDISRRLQVHAALQRSLDSYQQLISSAVFPIMIVVAAEIRFVNEASLKLLGVGQLSELIGQPLAHWLPPQAQAATLAALEQIIAGAGVPAVSCSLRRADGQHLAVEISGIHMDMDGSPAALLFLQDVTERVQVERQRSQAEATMRRRNQELTLLNELGRQIGRHLGERDFLQTLNEEVGQHILEADFFALLEVDQRGHSLTYAGAWLGHRPVATLDTELPFDQTPFLNAIMTGQPEILPWVATYADLHPELVSHFGADPGTTLVIPILSGTAVSSVLWAVRHEPDAFADMNATWLSTLAGQIGVTIENVALYAQAQREIEERRKAESALAAERELLAQRVADRTAELVQANADLQRAAQHREEFMASVSHELRTPLTGILGMAEALQRQTHGPLTPRQLRSVLQIEASGRHLLALINDLLDLSRINAGHLQLSIEKADVRGVSEASIAMVSALANENSVILCSQIGPAVRTMQADSRRLVQILVNLLSNAIKFSREGGRVGLDVDLQAEQNRMCFVVWDEGIGIAEADLEEIFQPFFQLDQGLDRQYGGSGLGLALVQRLVALHGGRVWVESALGQGSRFLVELPLTLLTGAMDSTGAI